MTQSNIIYVPSATEAILHLPDAADSAQAGTASAGTAPTAAASSPEHRSLLARIGAALAYMFQPWDSSVTFRPYR